MSFLGIVSLSLAGSVLIDSAIVWRLKTWPPSPIRRMLLRYEILELKILAGLFLGSLAALAVF